MEIVELLNYANIFKTLKNFKINKNKNLNDECNLDDQTNNCQINDSITVIYYIVFIFLFLIIIF